MKSRTTPPVRFLVLLLLTVSLPLCADIIVRRDGNQAAGRIVKETAAGLTIEGTFGQITIPRSDISSITREHMSQIHMFAADLEKNGPNEPLRDSINELRTKPLSPEEQQAYRDLVQKYQQKLAPAQPNQKQLESLDSAAAAEAQKLFDSMQISRGIDRLKQELSQRPGQSKCMGLLCQEVIQECNRYECTEVLKFLGTLKTTAASDSSAQANVEQGIEAIEKHFADLEAREAAHLAEQQKILAAIPTPVPLPESTPLPLYTPEVAATPPSLPVEETPATEESFPAGLDPNAPAEIPEEEDDEEYEEYEEMDTLDAIGSMPIGTQICFWIGYGISVIAGIWLLFLMFSESFLWGVAGVVIPFATLFFIFTHWEDAKYPFFASLAGGGFIVLGVVFVFV